MILLWSVNLGLFELNGVIALYKNDPTYGTGFKGKISMKLPVLSGKVESHAWFGAKEDYRYWHVDAFVPITYTSCPGFIY